MHASSCHTPVPSIHAGSRITTVVRMALTASFFARSTPVFMRVPTSPRSEWPREESNLRTQVRSLPLYPLSYGA
jgi:hypothetical protein